MSSLKGFSVVGVSAEESKNPVLTVTAGGLHFNKEAVKLLGNPDYVRVLINESSSQAAVQVCDRDADGAVKFNKILQEGVKRRGRKPKDPAAAAKKAAEAGITAIIQPGGSLKDSESIEAAEKYGIAMIFTGKRHFKH